ncbi:MAG: glycosyl transferase, partial [Verrucomicrobia bacterium]|nr:glycosyl transferase [Verrucomicrobiota bacterium]
HHLSLQIKPGRTETLVFVLGYAENTVENKFTDTGAMNKDPAYACLSRFDSHAKVTQEFAALQEEWSDLTSSISLQSSDPALNRMVNTWNPYQCMVTFNLSRSASYFESGIGRGMGFRDSNQDILGIAHMAPDRARRRIVDIAATQFADGGNWHQYQPLTKSGNAAAGSGFNDDPLWLILAVSCYIKETGDWGILQENVPFSDSPADASLLDHCAASMRHVEDNLGPHGLPLIGRADWNDCLNLNCFSAEPGESFQTCANKEGRTAESLVIAALYIAMGREYAEICRRSGEDTDAKQAIRNADLMEQRVHEHGWDGHWFLRAYDFFGQPVGGAANSEGRIYIEPQGLMVMAGVGRDNGMAQKALDSVAERLNTRYGIVLLDPPYTKYDERLGEITSYPPGYKENGGIFCHNNPWIIIAEALSGRPEKAWQYYRQICPAYIEEISDVHRTEPYVYSQMIAGKAAPRHGEAKNSWLTGTAAWNSAAVTHYLLGVRPDWDGLRIRPVLPDDIQKFTLVRRFRDTEYRIRVRKDPCTKNMQLRVNGDLIEGDLVPHDAGAYEADIECVLPA